MAQVIASPNPTLVLLTDLTDGTSREFVLLRPEVRLQTPVGRTHVEISGQAVPPGNIDAHADLPTRLARAVLRGDRDAVWPLIDAILESRERLDT